jgi:hypothetical protein
MSADLELSLIALGEALEVPEAPDFAARIALPGRPRHVRVTRRTLAIAAAATLLIAGTAMAVPASRDAVLRVLGLRGARIERVGTLPPIAPGTASRLKLGERIAPDRARHAASFTALVPPAADAAYLSHDVPGGRISILVGPDLLIELRAASSPYFLKLIDPGTRAKRVRVDGGPGVYLSGAVHELLFAAGNRVRSDRVLVAGNVLLWQHGALTLRIEGASSLRAALALARSLR